MSVKFLFVFIRDDLTHAAPDRRWRGESVAFCNYPFLFYNHNKAHPAAVTLRQSLPRALRFRSAPLRTGLTRGCAPIKTNTLKDASRSSNVLWHKNENTKGLEIENKFISLETLLLMNLLGEKWLECCEEKKMILDQTNKKIEIKNKQEKRIC